MDLAALRAKLNGVRGQQYWRSLDEVAETEEFKALLHGEFQEGAAEWPELLSRRSFLKLASASLALAGLTACTKQPVHQILPYVKQPENLVLGQPLYYATAMVLGGFATGVLAKSREGHPIKVDGNPQHPATRGGSSVWMQASILDLYDPDRAQALLHDGNATSWTAFLAEANQLVRVHEANQGEGLHVLTEAFTSPSLGAQLEDLRKRFPKAKVHSYDPISRDNVREGARLAFGEVVATQYRFDRAEVIVSLDADFLYVHPDRLRYARDFTDGRRLSQGAQKMNRLYVAESTPTVTGTMADERLALKSGDVERLARELARRLGALPHGESRTASFAAGWLDAVCRELEAHRERSLVIAGEWQPPAVQALAHLLNDTLGNVGKTIVYTEPAEARTAAEMPSLRELVEAMRAGAVQTLVILGGNPAYAAPADFQFGELLAKVKTSIHLSAALDETAVACAWHIPEAHYLETWGDARSYDGTVTMQQPLIEPLYGGKTAGEVLDTLLNPQQPRSSYEILRAHWEGQKRWADFERGWRKALCDGFVEGSASAEKPVALKREAISTAETPAGSAGEIEVTFRPDPSIWDGRFANNGWLQECAKPVSKLTWDNAVLVSPALAQRYQLLNDDVVEIDCHGRTVQGPVWITPGQAENSITLHLGYGRQRVGRVGAGVGFNAYALRTSEAFWEARGATLTKLNRRQPLVSTQTHRNLESPERQVHRETTLPEFLRNPMVVKQTVETPANEDTLYNVDEFKYEGHKWGMSIDLNTCIGCNACLVACEVENNIPVVGKEQVRMRREMYWIRIDTYFKGPLENPQFSHVPMPCMHCEHAPCELVCPTEATVHDHEGLNLMTYNRCVGTRFCSNNCPYKVRRFNFFQYTDYRTPSLKPMYNPEVTVRWRGVMEKCTYCVQRIAAARITAEKDNRRIRDGEVQTACQQACPAEAIVFGDLNDAESKIAKLKAHPLDYAMLGQLNTRPRTTYLAKIRNPGETDGINSENRTPNPERNPNPEHRTGIPAKE